MVKYVRRKSRKSIRRNSRKSIRRNSRKSIRRNSRKSIRRNSKKKYNLYGGVVNYAKGDSAPVPAPRHNRPTSTTNTTTTTPPCFDGQKLQCSVEERRIDSTDDKAYTLASFKDVYRGLVEWDAAPRTCNYRSTNGLCTYPRGPKSAFCIDHQCPTCISEKRRGDHACEACIRRPAIDLSIDPMTDPTIVTPDLQL